MQTLASRFVRFVFVSAGLYIAWTMAVHPYLLHQMNGAMSQVPTQYSGLLTAPAHAFQQLMAQLPTTSTGTTLP